MINLLINLHTKVFFFFHDLTQISPGFNYWVYVIAEKIDVYVLFVAAIILLLHRHGRRTNNQRILSRRSLTEGIYLLVAILLAWGISYLMKIGFAAPRPFLRFPAEVNALFPYGGYDSFPSGHSTLFASLAASLVLIHKKIGVFFILPALLIGVTRIIAGVHFPIDVLVGWLLGSLVSYFTYRYLSKRQL